MKRCYVVENLIEQHPLLALGRFFAVMTIIAVAICGCSKSTEPSPPDPSSEKLAALDAARDVQIEYANVWDSLVIHLDTVQAQDSLVELMMQDSTIDTAWATSQGFWIEHRCGMLGGIFTDLGREDDFSSVDADVKEPYLVASGTETSPLSKACVYFAPAYEEFKHGDDDVIVAADSFLALAGYKPFQVFRDEECSVDRMANIAGFGIIHINGHSAFLTNSQGVNKAYVMTGETVNSATDSNYVHDILEGGTGELGTRPIAEGYYSGKTLYFLSATFAAEHWASAAALTRPVVFLGFCYSRTGGWPANLKSINVLASLGFTGKVKTEFVNDQAKEFYRMMCDVDRERPWTISEWKTFLTNGNYRCYTLNGNEICVDYEADPDVTLWDGYLHVATTYPADGSVGVLPSLKMIMVTFSNELDASTVNASTFQISPSVQGEYHVDGAQAGLVLSSELTENTLYTMTLKPGVADTYGNTLEKPYSWTFKTATWEAAVGQFNTNISGTWFREDGSSSARFPSEFTLTKTYFGGGNYHSSEGDAYYMISDEFDLMLVDGDYNLIITYGVELASDTLWLSNWTSRIQYIR